MPSDSTIAWFLPENIREFTPPEAEHVDKIRRQLLDLYYSYGYQLVMPPLAEYRDALISGSGADLADITLNLHSNPDERSLGIRSDFTPQIARIDSRYQDTHSCGRYCYFGETLMTRPRRATGSRNPFQAGVELFGSNRISADMEMVELMLASVRDVSDKQLYVQLGHVGIFRRLCHLAGFDSIQTRMCEQIMSRRSINDIAAFTKSCTDNTDLARVLNRLPRMIGTVDLLDEAGQLLSPLDDTIALAIDQIRQVSDSINVMDSSVQVVIDLADVRGYSYHNAMLFACYCQDMLLAQGGRYDGIGTYFGHEKSATGFSIDIQALLALQRMERPQIIWIEKQHKEAAYDWIKDSRSAGKRCMTALDSSEQPPQWCSHKLQKGSSGWEVVIIDRMSGESSPNYSALSDDK